MYLYNQFLFTLSDTLCSKTRKAFVSSICNALRNREEVSKAGERRISIEIGQPPQAPKCNRIPMHASTAPDIRFDGFCLYPGHAKRGRCRSSISGHTTGQREKYCVTLSHERKLRNYRYNYQIIATKSTSVIYMVCNIFTNYSSDIFML